MTGPIAVGASLAVASGIALVAAGRLERRSAPELLAVQRLLTLVAAAVAPIAVTACAAAVLSTTAHGACGLGPSGSRWAAVGLYLLALAIALRLLWVASRIFRASRAALLRGPAALLAERIELPEGGEALVLPTGAPLAYTAGLGGGQIVVSRGLLDSLTRSERQALLAHELAHLRGRHQRMLFVGRVVAEAFPFLRPLQRVLASLRRELEAAADAEAAASVGDRVTAARAVAKAARAFAPAATAAAAGADLRDRLERLLQPSPRSRVASGAASATAALLAGAIVASVCTALHTGPTVAAVALCLSVLGAVALPPLVRGLEVGRRQYASSTSL